MGSYAPAVSIIPGFLIISRKTVVIRFGELDPSANGKGVTELAATPAKVPMETVFPKSLRDKLLINPPI
jgi:hypothetical protein